MGITGKHVQPLLHDSDEACAANCGDWLIFVSEGNGQPKLPNLSCMISRNQEGENRERDGSTRVFPSGLSTQRHSLSSGASRLLRPSTMYQRPYRVPILGLLSSCHETEGGYLAKRAVFPRSDILAGSVPGPDTTES